MILLGVILISSLLDVVYFFPIIKTAFFEDPAGENGSDAIKSVYIEREKPLYYFMVLPLAVTAFFSIIFCFFPRTFFILDLAETAIGNLMK